MKRILKSILIATASIGAIAGSTAAVVSCGETKNENQDKYNTALTALKGKLGTGDATILTNFHIQQGTTDFTNVQNDIQRRIDTLINGDASIKDILGAVTIKAPASSFNVTTAGATMITANNITMDVASDLANVTLPASSNISIKYLVVNPAQAAYDDAVKTIMTTISANAVESRNTFSVGSTPGTSAESQSEITTHLYELINNAIPAADKAVGKFASVRDIPGLTASATAIHEEILKGAATGKTISVTGITFVSKVGGLVTDPQSFTFNYSIAASPQKLYDAEMAALTSKFTTTGAGSIITQITNGSLNGDVLTKIQDAVKAEITKNPSSYTMLNGTTTTISGLKPNAFNNVPAAGANTPSNTLTAGVTITITPKDDTNVHPTAGGYAFAFQYTVGASAADTTAYEAALNTIGTQFNDKAHAITLAYNSNTTGDTWKVAVQTAILTAITTYLKATPDVGSLIDSSKINIQISGNSFVNSYTQGAVANTTSVTVSFPSVWGSITPPSPAPEFEFYYDVPATGDQLAYNIEAQEVLTKVATASQTKHISLYVGQTDAEARKTIAATINNFIGSLTPSQKAKIGVIPNDAVLDSIQGELPNLTKPFDGSTTTELQIRIPTTATSGVVAQQLTEELTIDVVATPSQAQKDYNNAIANILGGIPPANSSLFNWTAVVGTTPTASAHWLGGLTLKTYTAAELQSAISTSTAFQDLITAASLPFKVLLQANGALIGTPTPTVTLLPTSPATGTPANLNLAAAGVYNFELSMSFAGEPAGSIVAHPITLGFTITITAS